MTDVSGGLGVDDGFPSGGGEERSRFGRGWIPQNRDIGLPDDDPGLRRDVERVPHSAWDAGRKVRFLDHLAEKGDVRAACARVGMSRTSAYLLRRRDAAFARGWRAALVLARAHVEDVLATRALDGVEEAVWFRGELVGTRRKYDTRLLLAHLGRLDRAAEAGGGALADRFDEVLAIVAGERAGLDGTGDAPAPETGGAGALPPTRADWIASEAEPAWLAARGAWIDAVEAIDRPAVVDDEDDEDGEVAEAPDYPPAPDRDEVRRASAARWDAWQSRASARVAALLAGDIEYKSLDAAAWMAVGVRAGTSAGIGTGAGEGALDRVNRVNLTARRPRGTAGQKVSGSGNAKAGSRLSLVKAGAALPPPLPSCAGRHLFPTSQDGAAAFGLSR